MYEEMIMLKRTVCRYIAVLSAVTVLLGGCAWQKQKENTQGAINSEAITLQMRLPGSLNPLRCENQSVRDAFSLCYEPLFALDDKMNPEGVLARNINVTDDCMSAIVTLKDSVLWHDGIKFTSADVVYTINLLKGDSYSQYNDCVKYIESAQTVDPLTLRINLSRPYGQIAYSLYFPIVSSHNENLEENIVGTGAYMLEKYTPSVSLELKDNANWHGGEALCKKVTVSLVKDLETATTAFNAGMINTITNKSFDIENKTPKANTRTTYYPSSEYEFIAFNHNKRIFASSAIRSAVSCAIDRSSIVSDCYGTYAQEANAPLHPQSEKMAESSVSIQYNLANSNEILFLEGYSLNEKTGLLQNENGEKLSFTLLVNSENQSRIKCATVLQSQLFAAGIQMDIKETDFENYAKAIKDGTYDAYLGGTKIGNIFDFEFLLSESGSLNNYGYANEYMEMALAAIATAPSQDTLSDAISNFEEAFLRDQPLCGLVFKKDCLITSEKVMGKLLPQMDFPYKNIANWSVQ